MLCYNMVVTMLHIKHTEGRTEDVIFGKREKETALISKRELLMRYGISYGALYRWKRMGLIPEDWFLKQASTTGQETFFPEKLICDRVELILKKKDETSLEELALQFSGEQREEDFLVIDTVFGEKKFRRGDIRLVQILRGEGCEDISAVIEKYFQKKK